MEYKKLIKYPHLGPEDAAIWARFIAKNPGFFNNVEYDVKVGQGRDYSSLPKDQYSEDLKNLSLKRIDVVGFRQGEILVIELKPAATLAAIGEAIGYTQLFKEQDKTGKRISPAIITDQILPDIENVAEKNGVLIFQA